MSDSKDDSGVFAVPAARIPPKPKPSAAPPPPPEATPDTPQAPPLKYDKPNWSATPQINYGFEILRNGLSIERIAGPKKEFSVIGRLPLCDIQMEHPSISRYHALLQFNHDGDAYVYDLDSAHGTKVNKQRIPPRTYIKLNMGDQLRFGESTRLCIFETEKPPTEEDEERERQIAARHRARAAKVEHASKENDDEDEGINWGMPEDAVEEDDGEETEGGKANPDAILFSAEAEREAAEEAKRRREALEIMFGDDSDEESFYDKTDRKKKKPKKNTKAETYDDLVAKRKESEKKIEALQQQIELWKKEDMAEKARKKAEEEAGDEGDLDAYMSNLSKQPKKQVSLFKLQSELDKLKKEHVRLEKLIELTKPHDIFGNTK